MSTLETIDMDYSGAERRTRLDPRSYDDGIRDGKIQTLEESVSVLTKDVRALNRAIYMLGGALALFNFILPLFDFGISITP